MSQRFSTLRARVDASSVVDTEESAASGAKILAVVLPQPIATYRSSDWRGDGERAPDAPLGLARTEQEERRDDRRDEAHPGEAPVVDLDRDQQVRRDDREPLRRALRIGFPPSALATRNDDAQGPDDRVVVGRQVLGRVELVRPDVEEPEDDPHGGPVEAREDHGLRDGDVVLGVRHVAATVNDVTIVASKKVDLPARGARHPRHHAEDEPGGDRDGRDRHGRLHRAHPRPLGDLLGRGVGEQRRHDDVERPQLDRRWIEEQRLRPTTGARTCTAVERRRASLASVRRTAPTADDARSRG